mgnify:CR=1 FL=1
MEKIRTIIMGAAGRDFHNFNTFYRDNDAYEVVAFTATQIPNIEGRKYPAALAGSLYPAGIPIFPESELESLIQKEKIDQVVSKLDPKNPLTWVVMIEVESVKLVLTDFQTKLRSY